jgi:PDZ domain-containing protein
VRRQITAGRLFALGLVLVAVVLVLVIAPSNEYIFLPDRAHPVAPLVTVPGGHDPARGGIYFVDVVVRKATLLERLFGGLHNGADLYPASAINPPGVDDAQRQRIDLQDMRLSQQVAAAVALKAAGLKVILRPIGVRVEEIELGTPAAGKLEPDDVVTAIDGKPERSIGAVKATMARHKIGDVVRLTVIRGKSTLQIPIKTVASNDPGPRRPVVGVILGTAFAIHLPIDVRIDAGNVGGPSAGLAFALQVYEEEGHDVVHGNRVAATGEISANGAVGPIGGIKQKTIGAREAGVDAFLVPAGDNARDARKYAGGLRIIPVESFPQALRALATLPPAD